jgi:hypothetical protein
MIPHLFKIRFLTTSYYTFQILFLTAFLKTWPYFHNLMVLENLPQNSRILLLPSLVVGFLAEIQFGVNLYEFLTDEGNERAEDISIAFENSLMNEKDELEPAVLVLFFYIIGYGMSICISIEN